MAMKSRLLPNKKSIKPNRIAWHGHYICCTDIQVHRVDTELEHGGKYFFHKGPYYTFVAKTSHDV